MFPLRPMGRPGACPPHLTAWTKEEDELLLALHGKMSYQDIAEVLPRTATRGTVAARYAHLRRIYPDRLPLQWRRYSREEEQFIRDNAHKMTSGQIGEHLNRPAVAIRVKAGRMGVSLFKCGDLHCHTKHSDHDVNLIRALRDEGVPFSEIAEKFEPSPRVVEGLYRRRLTAMDAISRELQPR